MGYMNEFPHTRTFDSDLREIIDLYLTLKNLPKDFETLQKNFDDLKLFVTNYFNDLDVQNEINQKLDEMLADGSLLTLFSSCIINIKQFGAKGDRVTDDTTAINNAIVEHNKTGVPIYIPKGNYIINGLLTPITTDGEIFGTGTLEGSGSTGYMLTLKAKVKLSGIRIETSGYQGAILLDSTRQACVDYCTIISDSYGILINNSSQAMITNNYIVDCTDCIVITSENVDTGDNFFTGNTFDTTDGTNKNVLLFKSGGGIRFINNKVLTYDYGININSTGDTSVLVIDGNSMENGKFALTTRNTGNFGRIIFSNNQLTGYSLSINDNSYEVEIIGNIITGIQTENSIAVAISNSDGNISIEANIIKDFRFSVYNYTYTTNLRVANNNCNEFCRRAVLNNNAIIDEIYDRIVQTTGTGFNLGVIKPNVNGSCIAEITLNGATNKYAIVRVINTGGTISLTKIYSDLNVTCTETGVFVINESEVGETYVNTVIRGSVESLEL